jgi:hypothetical protein
LDNIIFNKKIVLKFLSYFNQPDDKEANLEMVNTVQMKNNCLTKYNY